MILDSLRDEGASSSEAVIQEGHGPSPVNEKVMASTTVAGR